MGKTYSDDGFAYGGVSGTGGSSVPGTPASARRAYDGASGQDLSNSSVGGSRRSFPDYSDSDYSLNDDYYDSDRYSDDGGETHSALVDAENAEDSRSRGDNEDGGVAKDIPKHLKELRQSMMEEHAFRRAIVSRASADSGSGESNAVAAQPSASSGGAAGGLDVDSMMVQIDARNRKMREMLTHQIEVRVKAATSELDRKLDHTMSMLQMLLDNAGLDHESFEPNETLDNKRSKFASKEKAVKSKAAAVGKQKGAVVSNMFSSVFGTKSAAAAPPSDSGSRTPSDADLSDYGSGSFSDGSYGAYSNSDYGSEGPASGSATYSY